MILEKTTIEGYTYFINYSNNIAIGNLLSLILKNFAELLKKNFVVPNIDWTEMDDAESIYVTNENNDVIGGICFTFNDNFNAAIIGIVFKDGEKYTKTLHEHCTKHLKVQVKKAGKAVIVQTVNFKNEIDLEYASHVGLDPTFYILSRSLLDDDQL